VSAEVFNQQGALRLLIDRMRLDCWACIQPGASEVRYWLANVDDSDLERGLSPAGNPIQCCKVRYVGTVPTGTTQTAGVR
jgi:hypothetical protein